jgi:Sortase and related acyltransferases
MITIRIATVEDAESIQKIYAPYVLNTTITFELEPPTVKEMADRIRHTLRKIPISSRSRRGRSDRICLCRDIV